MKPPGALNSARLYLETGRSVGIFPEGTVNRDPDRLLLGHRGAAYLSIATGTPVVPVGIRFPEADGRIGDHARMEVEIGAPLAPPRPKSRRPTRAELTGWHATLMGEISRLAGKAWSPHTTRACPAKVETGFANKDMLQKTGDQP
jgi:1-acyl-sn-glycerol-3-phosphate acyltransferase